MKKIIALLTGCSMLLSAVPVFPVTAAEDSYRLSTDGFSHEVTAGEEFTVEGVFLNDQAHPIQAIAPGTATATALTVSWDGWEASDTFEPLCPIQYHVKIAEDAVTGLHEIVFSLADAIQTEDGVPLNENTVGLHWYNIWVTGAEPEEASLPVIPIELNDVLPEGAEDERVSYQILDQYSTYNGLPGSLIRGDVVYRNLQIENNASLPIRKILPGCIKTDAYTVCWFGWNGRETVPGWDGTGEYINMTVKISVAEDAPTQTQWSMLPLESSLVTDDGVVLDRSRVKARLVFEPQIFASEAELNNPPKEVIERPAQTLFAVAEATDTDAVLFDLC